MVQSGACMPECLRSINEQANRKAGSLRGISWVYDTLLLENSFTNLAELDKSFSDGKLMLLWEPPSLDARIANQTGLLSIMNSADESQNNFLQTYSRQFQDMVIRIVINAAAKPEIRDMLDQNNISERTLFPGLPGFMRLAQTSLQQGVVMTVNCEKQPWRCVPSRPEPAGSSWA